MNRPPPRHSEPSAPLLVIAVLLGAVLGLVALAAFASSDPPPVVDVDVVPAVLVTTDISGLGSSLDGTAPSRSLL